MATDTNLTQLILNVLTQAQYDALETKDPNQIYAITDVQTFNMPALPIDAGAYVLKATVADDGSVTIQWVKE